MKEYATNEELARDYFAVVTSHYFGDRMAYSKVRKAIAGSEAFIPGWFNAFGRLDNLPLEGVGPDTRKLLEKIMVLGAREVIKEKCDDAQVKFEESLRRGHVGFWNRQRGPRESNPAFEGALKAREG